MLITPISKRPTPDPAATSFEPLSPNAIRPTKYATSTDNPPQMAYAGPSPSLSMANMALTSAPTIIAPATTPKGLTTGGEALDGSISAATSPAHRLPSPAPELVSTPNAIGCSTPPQYFSAIF